MEQARAVAHVDLAAVASNIELLRQRAKGAEFMAVVKANGYGHGAVPIARTAREVGVDYLGVAYPAEAVALRAAGDTGRLMAWLFSPGDDLAAPLAESVEIGVSCLDHLAQVRVAAQRVGVKANIHLKPDTGLGRNGAAPGDWPALLRAAANLEATGAIRIGGIWSHLACADEPDADTTRVQTAAFIADLAMATEHGVSPRVRHLANTAATLANPETYFDLVRCGIGIYGLSPGVAHGTAQDLGLQPAMTLSASVALVKSVPAGHGLSYGHRYRTKTDTRLALVPIGYADGVPRNGTNKIPVLLKGHRFLAAGTIAMDQFVLDVGDVDVAVGDTVTLFGSAAYGPSAQDWAAACDTINYEIVTRIGERVPRQYATLKHNSGAQADS
jgi:alanine racemase